MRRVYLIGFIAAAASCGGDGGACIIPPCALPTAFTVNVTAGAVGTPITNATVEVSGAESTTVPCNGTCMIPGPSGQYHLRVSAPGRAALSVDVTVKGHSSKCGCETVDMQVLAFPLFPV